MRSYSPIAALELSLDTSLFISVIGLMATFLEGRRGRAETGTAVTIEEYKEWLRRRDHTNTLELLESNNELLIATQQFLQAGHQEIITRLDGLDQTLAQMLLRTAGWDRIAASLDPPLRLPTQAISFLRWFEETGGSKAIEVRSTVGMCIVPMDGKGSAFEPEEPRLLESDLATLVELGLLILDYNSKGSSTYTITREAIQLVRDR